MLIAIVGFGVLMFGVAMVLGTIAVSQLVSSAVVLFGLALVVAGSGYFGYHWADGFSMFTSLSDVEKWSIVATFITTVVLSVLVVWAYVRGNVIWTATSVGALGGLVHEISQSGGTAFLPGTSKPSGTKTSREAQVDLLKGTKSEKPDEAGANGSGKGESYLGGLVGVTLGGVAGLLVLSASYPSVDTQLLVGAFGAGVALKGISDAAGSSKSNQG